MNPLEVLRWLEKIEKAIVNNGYFDILTKRHVKVMFQYIRRLVQYQIPKPPINVSDDGHKFECPSCHTKFESEDKAEDFYGCHVCQQKWKEVDKYENNEN